MNKRKNRKTINPEKLLKKQLKNTIFANLIKKRMSKHPTVENITQYIVEINRIYTELINQFVVYYTEGIKTSSELSKQMAAKARLLAEIIESSLNKDIENKEDTEPSNQYEGFK